MATSRKAAETSITVDAEIVDYNVVGSAIQSVQGFTHEDLESITSWDEAIKATAIVYGGVINAQEFEEVDKAELIDKPFLILSWEKGVKSDFAGSEFVIVKAMTPDNKKILFTDGSKGIKDYLLRLTSRTGRTGGVQATKGLRVSKYGLTADDMPCELGSPEQVGIGTTYYLN